jgi:hypothetical protein
MEKRGKSAGIKSDDDVATRTMYAAGVGAAELTFGSKSKAVRMAGDR